MIRRTDPMIYGEDRAKYGDKLINRLAKEINRKGFEPRSLRLYRRIYLVYPQLGTEIGVYLQNNCLGIPDASGNSIWQSATAKLQMPENQVDEIWQSAITKLEEWSTPADWLFNKLNFTSLAYLTSIDNPLKRAFYEQETIRGCWTARELDRQVSSQYYERMGLSKDKKALQKLAVKDAQQLSPREIPVATGTGDWVYFDVPTTCSNRRRTDRRRLMSAWRMRRCG